MVVILECDERCREIYPADPLERAQLWRDCLRHATWQNGLIDWEAYDSSYFGHMSFSDLSSKSNSDDFDDSDCIFLYTTSGKEIVARVSPQMTRGRGTTISEVESDTETFGDDVQSYTSVYCDQAKVNLFRSTNAGLCDRARRRHSHEAFPSWRDSMCPAPKGCEGDLSHVRGGSGEVRGTHSLHPISNGRFALPQRSSNSNPAP